MQYGLFLQLPRAADQDTATRYRETLDQIDLADPLGFENAGLAEMHVIPECAILPAPMVVGAAAAARTERIRIGIGVVLLPLHDPIRAAEDAATLDVLSAGLCRTKTRSRESLAPERECASQLEGHRGPPSSAESTRRTLTGI